MFTWQYIVFYVVILLTNVIQCITGFAGTVLAMPFSLRLVGYDVAKPLLNILGLAASIWVLIFNYKKVNVKELIKIVLIMVVGIVAGYFLMKYVTIDKKTLYIVLGVIVLVFSVIGILKTFVFEKRAQKRKEQNLESPQEPKKWLTICKVIIGYLILAVAGLVHGMYVCGGPLLVVYASSRLKDKDEFRATLSASWIVLNSIILVQDCVNGLMTVDKLPALGICLVVLIGALVIGNLIVKRMNKTFFMILTYVLMVISGVSLLI